MPERSPASTWTSPICCGRLRRNRVPGRMGVADLPSHSPQSAALARELRRRGFRFIGPTTAYSLMQATGMVDDHIEGCWVPPVGAPGAPAALGPGLFTPRAAHGGQW